MTFITRQELDQAIDNWAADDPLGALREGIAEYMTPYRLDACAAAEPLTALVYAGDLLTPERAASCLAAAEADGTLKRYVPDARASSWARLPRVFPRRKALISGRSRAWDGAAAEVSR
jgi:hypothetical protein